MLCDICQTSIATVRVLKVKEETEIYLNLCESCAKKLELDPATVDPQNPFSELLSDTKSQKNISKIENCPQCGSSLAELRASGKWGCEKCFEIFSEELRYLLEKATGARKHRGRLPEALTRVKSILVDKAGLNRKLKKALESENYERAAKIRDRIERLEKEV